MFKLLYKNIKGSILSFVAVMVLVLVVSETLESAPSQVDIFGEETITTSGKYDNINIIRANRTVTIEGDVALYVTGDVVLTKQDDSLTLYPEGTNAQKNDVHLGNRTKDPCKVAIFGLDGCDSIYLLTYSNLYGTIYAPNADLELQNNVKFPRLGVSKFPRVKTRGIFWDGQARPTTSDTSIHGLKPVVLRRKNKFLQRATADFNYDTSPRDANINNVGVQFVVECRQES